MYPNSALSAGQLAAIAVVAIVCLAIWISAVFIAAREPRRDIGAGTAASPRQPAETAETAEPQRKAA